MCLVTAIANYTSIFAQDNTNEEAVKFLLHLGGDLFQPYHAGREDDVGGNKIEVTFFGKKTNVHSVCSKL